MKRLLAGLGLVALASSPAAAQTQSQNQTQDRPAMRQPPQTQQQGAASQRWGYRMRGNITQVEGDRLTLDVQGTKVDLSGDKEQLSGLKAGDEVVTVIVPLYEAKSITPLEDVAIEKQAEGNKPNSAVVVGEVDDVQENVLVLETPERGTKEVKINKNTADQLSDGQQLVVEMEGPPSEPSGWRIVRIEKAR